MRRMNATSILGSVMHIAQPPQTEQRKTLAISAFETHFVSCVLHDCPMAAVHPCKRLETTYHFALIPSWFGFFSSSSSSRFRVGLVNCIPNIVDDVVNDRVFVVRTNELCVCVRRLLEWPFLVAVNKSQNTKERFPEWKKHTPREWPCSLHAIFQSEHRLVCGSL